MHLRHGEAHAARHEVPQRRGVRAREQAGDPLYDKMVDDVCKDTKRAGKIFGTTMPTQAEGEAFSSDARFFYTGPSHDGWERSDYVDPYKDAKKK